KSSRYAKILTDSATDFHRCGGEILPTDLTDWHRFRKDTRPSLSGSEEWDSGGAKLRTEESGAEMVSDSVSVLGTYRVQSTRIISAIFHFFGVSSWVVLTSFKPASGWQALTVARC